MHALKAARAQRASVLIVEDEALIARDLEATLEDMGYRVTGVAASSREALEASSKRCPDLVLMDIRLRGEPDGIETAAVLRERFHVPVVFLTAHADDDTLQRAAETRPYGYLLKPFKAIDVKSAIELALHRHGVDTQLVERERWLSTTVQAISDAVIACDDKETVRFMNPAAEKLTGWTREDAIGKSLEDVFQLVSRQTGARLDNPVSSALAAKNGDANGAVRTVSTNGKLVDKNGNHDRVVDNTVAHVVEDGKVQGAVLVFRDATEKSRLQERADVAERLGSLGTMAASLAHEINNPLTFNIGNLGFALRELRDARDANDPTIVGRLDRIIEALLDAQNGAERIARIVADLRALSKTSSETRHTIDVCACVSQAIKLTSHQLALAARIVEELDDTPPCSGNDVRLSQVVVNLLVNAAQALTGPPELNEIRVVTKTLRDGHAAIEVHDTGSGIPAAIIDKIFDPFFTTKDAVKGTGLGLAISRGIVKSLGGELTVESREGKGSCFRVVLPPGRAEEPPVPEEYKPQTVKRARILLIDDEALLRKAIHWMLSPFHEVTLADGAEAALEALEKREFDLILCDLMMPRVGGMDLYQQLLERNPAQGARIVFMTGGSFQPRVAEFIMKMQDRCIQKPFSRERLLAFVEEMMVLS